ncbi:ankyrin repeat-containing domain protein [Hypoxylon sp. FL1284]|nr:ankyrin repeat-containing domain protein [Hypoxylon sp. FL1284]
MKDREREILTHSSALLEAIESRNTKLVELLINRDARVNEPPRLCLRRTPLQKAAEVGSLEIVRLLLDRGADTDAPAARRYGGTALQFAAISGNCTMATELIERGVRLDAPPSLGKEGRWPLEGAAEHGRIDMIQLLWDASFGLVNDRQFGRAARLAEENGHIGCRDRIRELMSASRAVLGLQMPTPQAGLSGGSWQDGDLSALG